MRGNRVLSPAALDRVIRDLDSDGKLDFIFGKQGAQQMRDLRELALIAKTIPPEAMVNYSNTAYTLLAAMGDATFSGITGTPAPILSLTKFTRQYIKDVKLRRRIDDALGITQRKAPGKPRQAVQEPPADTIH